VKFAVHRMLRELDEFRLMLADSRAPAVWGNDEDRDEELLYAVYHAMCAIRKLFQLCALPARLKRRKITVTCYLSASSAGSSASLGERFDLADPDLTTMSYWDIINSLVHVEDSGVLIQRGGHGRAAICWSDERPDTLRRVELHELQELVACIQEFTRPNRFPHEPERFFTVS
jgi:hypothetical protein